MVKKNKPEYLDQHYIELEYFANAFGDHDKQPHFGYLDKNTSKVIIVTHNPHEFDYSKMIVHKRNVVSLDPYNRTWREDKNILAIRKLTAQELKSLRRTTPKTGCKKMYISKKLLRDLT